MSINITTAFVQQFKDNVMQLVQQKGSKLRNAVHLKPNVVGEYFWQEQLGATTAVKSTSRHADTPLVNSDHYRRRGTMFDFDWADLIDSQDKLRMLIDPTSDYANNAADAMARAMDMRSSRLSTPLPTLARREPRQSPSGTTWTGQRPSRRFSAP